MEYIFYVTIYLTHIHDHFLRSLSWRFWLQGLFFVHFFFRCCGIIQSWPRRYQVLPDAPELQDVPCHSLELPNDNVPARASLRVIASVKPYDLPPVSIQSIWVQLHLFNQLFLCSFHFHCFFPRTTCHWKLLEERNYHFLTSFFLAFECEWEMRSSNRRQSIIILGVLLLGIALQSSALLYNFFCNKYKNLFFSAQTRKWILAPFIYIIYLQVIGDNMK